MNGHLRDRSLQLLLFALGLFVAGRFLGLGPLEDAWSFSHWIFSPSWYPFAWVAGLGAVTAALWMWLPKVASVRTATVAAVAIAACALAAFWLLRFDSFVYGGGNLRVAQVAQAEVLIIRWFEYGTLAIIALLFKLYRALDVPVLYAAGRAWFALAFLSAVVAAAGAFRLATLMTDQPGKRLGAFVVAWFGGHALLYFGFVGVEVVVAPIVLWFAAAVLQLHRTRSGLSLLVMWVVVGFGVFLFFPLAFLVPAAVCATLAMTSRRKTVSRLPAIGGWITLALLVVFVYWKASQSLEFATYLLWPSGKLPFSDYGILSVRRLADWLQVTFLAAPLLITAFGFRLFRLDTDSRPVIGAFWMLVCAGMVALLILDPMFGAAPDYPRFAVYLVPVGILIAVLLTMRKSSEPVAGAKTLAVAAAFAVFLPLAVLPVHVQIERAEQYASDYLERHEPYYRTASLGFRDSYFYHRNWDESARWDKLLPVHSSDYMNLRGTDYLAQNKEYEEALKVQYRIIAKYPYWAEPRSLAAVNQMTLGRFSLAKAQIDTCLMLEPYKLEHWRNLYAYYRDIQNYPEAFKAISRAEALAPSDPEVLTDKMIISYRIQDLTTANALADELLARDSLLAFPYLIKAFVADKSQDPRGAVTYYEKFMKLGPNEPEVPRVQSRVESLKMALEGR